MIEPATRLIDVWPFAVAAVLLVIDLSLVIALSAMTALGPVSLRRFSSERMPHLAFVENLPRPDSAHKMAAHGLQQICLLGTMTLVAYALRLRGVATPALVAWLGTVLVMVLGLHMFVARGLAMWKPHRAFPVTLWSMRLAFVCLYPLVVAARAWIRRIAEVQARLEDERDEDQDEQVEALIEVGERSGLLEAEEGKMMRGIVDLDETLVREIMTPRTEIVAVEVGTTVDEARGRILDSGHSRLPVYRETIDNVVGVLHSRDLFQAWKAGEDDRAVAHYLRPAVFVPETLSAAELLAEMRQRTQIALVVDEYGGVAGLITLEDVLEEIVGDIRDEHDSEEDLLQQESDGSWVVDAAAHVEELEELFDVEFGERDYDTVGGLVVSGFGRVPNVGESMISHGLNVEVLMADHRRVRKVRVRRDSSEQKATGGA